MSEPRIPIFTDHFDPYFKGILMNELSKETQTRMAAALAGGWVADAASLYGDAEVLTSS